MMIFVGYFKELIDIFL